MKRPFSKAVTKTYSEKRPNIRFDWIKDRVALVSSLAALTIAIYGFVEQNVIHQHELRATVLGVGGYNGEKIEGTVIIANTGTHSEVLYDIWFDFINTSHPQRSSSCLVQEALGVKPAEVMNLRLSCTKPAVISDAQRQQQQTLFQVRLRAVDKNGNIPNNDNAKRYVYTVWSPNGSATPPANASSNFIDLL